MQGILTDDNGDIKVVQGTKTAAIGDNTQDVIQRVLEAHKGEFKEYPLLGCNVRSMIGGATDPFATGNIKQQLKIAGVTVSDVTIDNTGIQIKLK